jgi:hypothetical protein
MCILPCNTDHSTATKSECDNVVADRRSMKAMYASLYGIPIVSSAWINQCLQQKQISVPEVTLFVRTLPTKTNIGPISDFGVAYQAARIGHAQQQQQRSPMSYLPLRQVKIVYMVGFETKSNDATNFTALLRRAGVGEVTVNPSIALSRLKDFLTDGKGVIENQAKSSTAERYVVLCNDDASKATPNQKKMSLSDSFVRVVHDYITISPKSTNSNRRVMVVNLQWLFDCITCGDLLHADTAAAMTDIKCAGLKDHDCVHCYQPVDERARELWQRTK